MADFTIANLEAAAKNYVDATKQLKGTFTPKLVKCALFIFLM